MSDRDNMLPVVQGDAERGGPGYAGRELGELYEQPGASLQQQDDEAHPLRKLHHLFRGRYHWAILLGVLGAAIGGSAGYFAVKPKYQSKGMIQVDSALPVLFKPTPESAPVLDFGGLVHSQVALLESRRVLDLAYEAPEWKEINNRRAVPITPEQFAAGLEVTSAEGQREVYVAFSDPDPDAATVATKAIISAYTAVYSENNTLDKGRIMSVLIAHRTTLTTGIQSLKDQILTIAGAFGTDNLVQNYELKFQQAQEFEKALQETKIALAAVEASERAGGEPAGKPAGSLEPEDVGRVDTKMRDLLNAREASERHLAELSGKYGDQHREVIAERNQLDFTNLQIQQMMGRYRASAASPAATRPSGGAGPAATRPRTGLPTESQVLLGLGNDVDSLKTKQEKLRQFAEAATAESRDIGKKRMLLTNMQESLVSLKEDLRDTADRIKQLSALTEVPDRIHVISYGDRPFGPSNRKNRIQLAILGALGLGGLGMGVVALFGLRDRSLKTIDDARTGLGNVPMLGILPRLPLDLKDPQQAAIAAHCVHQIRTMVQIGAGRWPSQVIAVTSPAAGTGKTSLSIALGLSFAACGSRTLLIDSDLVGRGLSIRTGAVVREKLGQILLNRHVVTAAQVESALAEATAAGKPLGKVLVDRGQVSAEQLAEALEEQGKTSLGILEALGGMDFDFCTTSIHGQDLHILPVGSALGRQAVALSPTSIRRLIAEARTRYDTVLIDTGPVPGSLEGSMVGAAADGVVLVVSQGDHRPLAEAAAAHLRSVGRGLAGLVFNRAAVEDIARSVYMSASREQAVRSRPDVPEPAEPVGEPLSPRLGPIASAVATYAPAGLGASRAPRPGALPPPRSTPHTTHAG